MREEIMDWINFLPAGWVSAFGEELCDDLLRALGEHAADFVIDEVKEKYGEMRMYWEWRGREYLVPMSDELWELTTLIFDIQEHYAMLSRHTCAKCGAPATMRTINGWDEPLCDNCCS